MLLFRLILAGRYYRNGSGQKCRFACLDMFGYNTKERKIIVSHSEDAVKKIQRRQTFVTIIYWFWINISWWRIDDNAFVRNGLWRNPRLIDSFNLFNSWNFDTTKTTWWLFIFKAFPEKNVLVSICLSVWFKRWK